ncbi:MAG: peptide maturation system acyl carrier-related protein [Ruminiclostridium sp.]
MIVNKTKIEGELKNIFFKRVGLDFDAIGRSALDDQLLGYNIQLVSTDLLYIFLDVEKEFNIKVTELEVAKGHFDTFNNIVGIIERQIREAENCV